MARPQAAEIRVEDLSDEELVKLAVHVLRELSSRVSGALHYLDMYKNCSVELTWVRNKVGRHYYYYYLKCRDGRPKSVYLGNKHKLMAKIQRIKSIRSELRIAHRIYRLINELSVWITHLNYILPLIRTIEEQVKE